MHNGFLAHVLSGIRDLGICLSRYSSMGEETQYMTDLKKFPYRPGSTAPIIYWDEQHIKDRVRKRLERERRI